jgi:hypothetical protein
MEGSTSGAQTDYQTRIVVHQGLGTDYNDNEKAPPEGHVYLGELPSEDLSQWEISVNSTIHENYGLTYPLTYVFNIASEATSPKVYYRFLLEQNWTQLPEKTENDFFNGINAARFDDSNNKVYLSIAFSDLSDKIYLNFTDNYDKPLEAEFVETTKYDNRKAVVVSTADDWIQAYNDYFENACDAFRTRDIWLTVAIVTDSAPWADIQRELDAGYIEPASHSYDHPATIPYLDYDLEIGASKQQIIGNLTLPPLNTKGSLEYVWAWIESSGSSDVTVRTDLGKYMYLCDRNVDSADIFAS